jgi:hypothetical protein
MKWKVILRHRQYQCCPPGSSYWRLHEITVEADNKQLAEDKVLAQWAWDGQVEIKTIEQLSD